MGVISGEAIVDEASGKWGWLIKDDEGNKVIEPDFIFDSKIEAELELINAFKELGKFAS